MSFLPYAPASGSAWFASITGSTAIHGMAVTAVLTSSVALLPDPTSPAVREPEYEITIETFDADMIELEDFEIEREIPEDAVAIEADDGFGEELDQSVLPEEEFAALEPEETLLAPEEDVIEAEPEIVEAEPEVVEAEPEPVLPEEEIVEAEETAPVVEEEDLALLTPEEDTIEPEVIEAPEEVVEAEELPDPSVSEPIAAVEAPDPDELVVDDLSLIDDTVFSPLADAVAPAAPDDTALAPDIVVPDVVEPEVQVIEEEVAAVVLPDPEPAAPDVVTLEPEAEPVSPAALPAEPEAAPEETAEAEAQPQITEPEAPRPTATVLSNPSPAALQIGSLLQRIRATPAPQCALALPRRAGESGVGISFIGASPGDLDVLATRILDGLETPPAQTREILDARQCAALDAIRLSNTYPASRIGLAIEDTTLASGDSLQARVLGAGGLFLTLVLIDDNGVVQDLARFTTLEGDIPVIDAPVARSGPSRDTRQVLIVLGSADAPIDLSDGIGRLAQDAFANVPATVLENALFGLATFDVR